MYSFWYSIPNILGGSLYYAYQVLYTVGITDGWHLGNGFVSSRLVIPYDGCIFPRSCIWRSFIPVGSVVSSWPSRPDYLQNLFVSGS